MESTYICSEWVDLQKSCYSQIIYSVLGWGFFREEWLPTNEPRHCFKSLRGFFFFSLCEKIYSAVVLCCISTPPWQIHCPHSFNIVAPPLFFAVCMCWIQRKEKLRDRKRRKLLERRCDCWTQGQVWRAVPTQRNRWTTTNEQHDDLKNEEEGEKGTSQRKEMKNIQPERQTGRKMCNEIKINNNEKKINYTATKINYKETKNTFKLIKNNHKDNKQTQKKGKKMSTCPSPQAVYFLSD